MTVVAFRIIPTLMLVAVIRLSRPIEQHQFIAGTVVIVANGTDTSLGASVLPPSRIIPLTPCIASSRTKSCREAWSRSPVDAPITAPPACSISPMSLVAQPAHLVMPWIHRVFSNFKAWALGVYYGLRPKHLQAYLNEFIFCFNRRRTCHAAFRSLLGITTRRPQLLTIC